MSPVEMPIEQKKRNVQYARVNGAHISGKFSAKAKANARYVRELADKFHLHWFMTTEFQSTGTLRRLRRAMPDFYVYKNGEHVIGLKRSEFFPVELNKPNGKRARQQLRNKKLSNTPGMPAWREYNVVSKRARHRQSDRLFNFYVVHAPSGIQKGDRWNTDDDWSRLGTEAVKEATSKLGDYIHSRHSADNVSILTGDMNQDLNNKVWRNWLVKNLRMRHIMCVSRDRTTLGDRRVDAGFHLGSGFTGASSVVQDRQVQRPGRYDHQTILIHHDVEKR